MDKYLIKTSQKEESSTSQSIQSSQQKKSLKRKYDLEYLKFGFVPSDSDEALPFCLLCLKSLSNESMVPSKLQRHLNTSHPLQKDKTIQYFEQLQQERQNQSKKMKKSFSIPARAQITSYQIAQLIAERKKPHSDAEGLILPAMLIAVENMLGHEAINKINCIPLSTQSISRRIDDMSSDIKEQLKSQFVESTAKFEKLWSIQVDESTDISNKAQLLSYLRLIRDGKIMTQFFFCSELKERTTGEEIFKLVNEKVLSNGMLWENCINICTDGAPAMQGKSKGFVSYALKENPEINVIHCMIHKEVLVSKCLPEDLLKVMNNVVKVVNHIKSNALRSRIFAALCDSMQSEFKCLIYHTEVRWLSKGKVLARFVSLKSELLSFFVADDDKFAFLSDEDFWLKVLFLNDIFEKLNILNISIQGPNENMITITGKLKSFKEKLHLWILKVQNKQFDCFPSVNSHEHKLAILEDIKRTLKNLLNSLKKYFPVLETKFNEWIVNPFMDSDVSLLSNAEQEQLIDIKNDVMLKGDFSKMELSEFWISIGAQYPELSYSAIKILLPFGSSYLCELGFSALTEIKSKKRERLQIVDQEMRVCLSAIKPRLDIICANKQAHPSH